MPTYLFHLGREPQLSTAEIEAVFSAWGIDYKFRRHRFSGPSPQTRGGWEGLIIETKQPLDAVALMHRLGGTIKISDQISSTKSPLLTIIAHLTQAQPTGKIDFAVPDRALALKIKKELRAQGRGARFITINNTATILFNQLVEKQGDLTVLNDQVFVTRAIQPIAELSERDYGRPGSDAKGGMLPPKLAQTMINLAQVPLDATILDPFCGSGTILMEAAVMGYKHLIGSDISPKAIADTKKNLNWLKKTYNLKPITYNLYTQDVRSLDKLLNPNSVNAIVTEPFLGKPLTGRETKSFLERQAQELAALYAETFASFQKILKPNGVVVVITPAFKYKNNWITPLDLCKSVPKISGPIRYHRPGQHLARDIWRFTK